VEWLEQIVTEGRATSLGGNGYPCTYTIKASVLVGALRAGAPNISPGEQVIVGDDYIARSGTVTDFRIDWAVLGECPPDEELFVEAWDLS
jgi:hypothetical protein